MQERCIGCKTCVVACPYGAMEVVVRPVIRHSGAGLNVVAEKAEANKCDLCFHRESGPACMEVCPTHALVCVDRNKLEQMNIEKRRRTALAPVSQGMNGVQIRIRGKVQGWGSAPLSGSWPGRRPAAAMSVTTATAYWCGWSGGDDGFTAALADHCPPLARIDSTACIPYRWAATPQDFTIRESGRDGCGLRLCPMPRPARRASRR